MARRLGRQYIEGRYREVARTTDLIQARHFALGLFMMSGSPKLERRERALEAARRRLRRLEIETHRIKAELARLEAEYEDDVADQLSRTLRRRRTAPVTDRFDRAHAAGSDTARATAVSSSDSTAEPRGLLTRVPTPVRRGRGAGPAHVRLHSDGATSVAAAAAPEALTLAVGAQAVPVGTSASVRRAARRRNPSSRPLAASLVIHAIGLVLCTSFGFATLVQHNVPLFAGPPEPIDELPPELAEVEIPPTEFTDQDNQNVVSEVDEFNLADIASPEVESAQLGAGTQALGDLGQLDALPSDVGTLLAGAGAPGKGPHGVEPEEAVFFGARSQGNRFVFVVDNSSSMKGGRLDQAVAELRRTVDALTPRQAFFVIFVSDQTYPMFYPQPALDLVPATGPNRARLALWLPNAMLASGRNRELIKAMDLAASLRPDVVYLLWDGDLRYSDRVRAEVMLHLTQPNQWSFPIHTLGMGALSLDAEQNLAAIAAAHGGTFRRVDVTAPRGR